MQISTDLGTNLVSVRQALKTLSCEVNQEDRILVSGQDFCLSVSPAQSISLSTFHFLGIHAACLALSSCIRQPKRSTWQAHPSSQGSGWSPDPWTPRAVFSCSTTLPYRPGPTNSTQPLKPCFCQPSHPDVMTQELWGRLPGGGSLLSAQRLS